jgi:hypothetical protein
MTDILTTLELKAQKARAAAEKAAQAVRDEAEARAKAERERAYTFDSAWLEGYDPTALRAAVVDSYAALVAALEAGKPFSSQLRDTVLAIGRERASMLRARDLRDQGHELTEAGKLADFTAPGHLDAEGRVIPHDMYRNISALHLVAEQVLTSAIATAAGHVLLAEQEAHDQARAKAVEGGK